MTFRIEFTVDARVDLKRLYAFVLARELEREGGDLELAERALAAIFQKVSSLERTPFTCRKADGDARMRELVVPFGATGYVVLFDITDGEQVKVLAVRHQLENGRRG